MSKIKTLIIDDEPIALEKLRNYVNNVPFMELVASCQGSSEAMEYLASNTVDVIFTDINMPDVNGIEFIEALMPRPLVVFTTAYRDYAVDGFRLWAVDYLVKPYRQVDFQRAANKVLAVYKAMHNEAVHVNELSGESTAQPAGKEEVEGQNPRPVQMARQGSDSIFVKVETRYERVSLSDIRYIKGYGEYLQLYIEGVARPLLTLSSFASMMEYLTDNFIQIHRSYIVNTDHIIKIEKNRIVMDAETYLPISNSYRDTFMNYIQARSVGRARAKQD